MQMKVINVVVILMKIFVFLNVLFSPLAPSNITLPTKELNECQV